TSIYTEWNALGEKRFNAIVGNPKPECRNPKEIRMSNPKSGTSRAGLRIPVFGLLSGFGFRVSAFGFVIHFHCCQPSLNALNKTKCPRSLNNFVPHVKPGNSRFHRLRKSQKSAPTSSAR